MTLIEPGFRVPVCCADIASDSRSPLKWRLCLKGHLRMRANPPQCADGVEKSEAVRFMLLNVPNSEPLSEQEISPGGSIMLRSSPEKAGDATKPPTSADESDDPSMVRHSAVHLVARDLSLDESCRRSLSDAGVDVVVSVPNSARALELLNTSQLFDAVVIGVGPGDVEAVILAQQVRRHRSQTPTVVMSPIGNLEIPGAVNQGTVANRFGTSRHPNTFRETIRKALGMRRSARLRRPS